MKHFRRLTIFFFLLILPINLLNANEKTAFIDIDYILQNSNIGKKSLKTISDLNNKNIKELEEKNKSLIELEDSIRKKKNIISEVDFNKEVEAFQKKVKNFTNQKNQTVKKFNDFRKKELEKIFKLFNPIISNYMKQNSINILIDAKNIFMGNDSVNLTENVLKIINDELK
jgi:outer membrane protein